MPAQPRRLTRHARASAAACGDPGNCDLAGMRGLLCRQLEQTIREYDTANRQLYVPVIFYLSRWQGRQLSVTPHGDAEPCRWLDGA